MSERLIDTEILCWIPPIEEETSTVNLLLPQYYLISHPSPFVNERPGIFISDYFIQSSTSFLGTTSITPKIEPDTLNRADIIPSPPLTCNGNMTSNGVSDNQPSRKSHCRRSLDQETRIARRRERNRLAAKRFRDRSRNYCNQLEQRVTELEAEVTRLRSLLDLDCKINH